MLYPLTFKPIFKERVWGGRNLEQLYGKALPPAKPIGESWEISDRPGDASVVANGRLAGKDLHWLMEHHGPELLGTAKPARDRRFPLLCKILDCAERLSLQVHPPQDVAARLGGEPKSEMWYVADAAAGAELFVGLKRRVTRAEFEKRIGEGTVAECVHRIPIVRPGDAVFIPSGCVHAIGAGLVIFEIQQNSDTTYRVFDWNRVGLDGKPRELHIAQSLESIDFEGFKPGLIRGKSGSRMLGGFCHFNIRRWRIEAGKRRLLKSNRMQILAVAEGRIGVPSGTDLLGLSAGQFCLIPASVAATEIVANSDVMLLCVEAGG